MMCSLNFFSGVLNCISSDLGLIGRILLEITVWFERTTGICYKGILIYLSEAL